MNLERSTTTVVQVVVVSSGPEINNEQFQGWHIAEEGDSLEAINCPESQSLLMTKNYAQCCDIGATTCSTLWTSCAGTRPIGVSTDTCDPSSFCQTVSIFDQYPLNNAPVYSQIICAVSAWAASSIYRNVVTTTTKTSLSTITAASISPKATTNTAVNTQSSMETSNTSASQTTPTSTSTPGLSPSQAWIAGAVLGPLAAIAIIALLLWVFRLRRKREHNRSMSPATIVAGYAYGQEDYTTAQLPSGNESYRMHIIQQKIHEMHTDYLREGPQELPGSGRARLA